MKKKALAMMPDGRVLVKSIVLSVMLLTLHPFLSEAGDKRLNIQGKLTTSAGNPITGTKNLYFRLYDAESGGSPLWLEQQSVNLGSDGLFNVSLGSGTSLDGLAFDRQYYLGITVNGEEEMVPRQKLGSSPYAMGSLGDFGIKKNLSVGNNLDIAGNQEIGGSSTINGNLIIPGTSKVGIGTTNPISPLTIEKDPQASLASMLELSGGSHMHHPYEGSGMSIIFKDSDNTNPAQEMASIGYVRVGPVWRSDLFFRTKKADASVAEAMRITGTGNVGIGTTNPEKPFVVSHYLDVDDGIRFVHANGTQGLYLGYSGIRKYTTDGNNDLSIAAASNGNLLLNTSGGNVGIGTASPFSGAGWAQPGFEISGARGTLGLTTVNAGGLSTIRFKGPTQYSEMHLNYSDSSSPMLTLYSYGPYPGREVMRILGDGRIGVGTTNPVPWARLSVNGDIRIGAQGAGVVRLYDSDSQGEAMTFWQTNPSRTVDIWAHLWTDGYHTHSDMRLKSYVEKLPNNVLDRVMQLQGISYTWNKDEYKKMKRKHKDLAREKVQQSSGTVSLQTQDEADEKLPDYLNKREIGLSAQELEKRFPELVTEDPRGYKGIDYSKLSVVLLEAIKEQQKQIDELRAKINK